MFQRLLIALAQLKVKIQESCIRLFLINRLVNY